MEYIKNREREMKAELELEEALDDRKLSENDRAVIEEQLRTIRLLYNNMMEELYA